MTTPTLAQRIDRFDAYFRSSNCVPPNARISVPTAEWQELRAALANLATSPTQCLHQIAEPAAPAADALTPAARDVLAERARQISAEGWTPEHDDQYRPGELLMAADSYISWNCGEYEPGAVPINWPWKLEWFKPTTERRNLEKAGALILAEIERIDRAAIAARAAQGGSHD